MALADSILLGHAALLVLIWGLLFHRLDAALRQVRPLKEVLGRTPGPRRKLSLASSLGVGSDRSITAGDAESLAGSASGSGPAPLPPLSVVITARDEAASISSSVRSVLEQSYADLQLIVVDDRSSDGTGKILDGLARGAEGAGRLEVIHNRSVPAGWLGKCHACRLGAERARGDWILFMDGDVSLDRRDILSGTIRHARQHGVDHVAVIPDLGPLGPLHGAVVALFGGLYLLVTRAHEIDRDLPRGGAGVGAFNLVRREAYERIGGHERLRFDPGDDVKLGQLLKRSGAKQRLYSGLELVACRWQPGVRGVVKGLEKNAFSGAGYSLVTLAAFTAGSIWIALGPTAHALAAAVLQRGAGLEGLAVAGAPLIAQAGLLAGGWLRHGRRERVPAAAIVLHPLAAVLLCAAAWNSALRALWRGGIEWRGDFYPLAELRRGLVRPESEGGPADAGPRARLTDAQDVLARDGEIWLRKMRDEAADYDAMSRWLSDERVLAFYGGRDRPRSRDEISSKYGPRARGEDPVEACLILRRNEPIGYLQFYKVARAAEYGLVQDACAEGLFGIDLFIGEPELWGRGIGSRALEAISRYLFVQRRARRLVIDPQVDNARAIRCYEKAGFRRMRILPAHEDHEGTARDCWLMIMEAPARQTVE